MSLGSFKNQNPKSSEGFEFFQFAYGKLKTAIQLQIYRNCGTIHI